MAATVAEAHTAVVATAVAAMVLQFALVQRRAGSLLVQEHQDWKKGPLAAC